MRTKPGPILLIGSDRMAPLLRTGTDPHGLDESISLSSSTGLLATTSAKKGSVPRRDMSLHISHGCTALGSHIMPSGEIGDHQQTMTVRPS